MCLLKRGDNYVKHKREVITWNVNVKIIMWNMNQAFVKTKRILEAAIGSIYFNNKISELALITLISSKYLYYTVLPSEGWTV